jgi:bacterioferritin-associated ferredoxin
MRQRYLDLVAQSIPCENQCMGTTSIFSAVIPGRDEIHLGADGHLRVIGCPEVLALCETWRAKLKGDAKQWPLPEGNSHAAILLREAILKARGAWQLPYHEDELCHCRVVATSKVDAAIVTGAHTVSEVSRRTSAGTSCGTCQPDIQKLIKYRTQK